MSRRKQLRLPLWNQCTHLQPWTMIIIDNYAEPPGRQYGGSDGPSENATFAAAAVRPRAVLLRHVAAQVGQQRGCREVRRIR